MGLSGSSPTPLVPASMALDATALSTGPDQQQMDQQAHPSGGSSQLLTTGSAKAVCAALPGLVSRQIQVCQAHPNTIQSVSDGARKVSLFNGL